MFNSVEMATYIIIWNLKDSMLKNVNETQKYMALTTIPTLKVCIKKGSRFFKVMFYL